MVTKIIRQGCLQGVQKAKGSTFLLTGLIVIILSLSSGCQLHRNGPPQTDKPDPGPFVGEYVSDYGSMSFDENGFVKLSPSGRWLEWLVLIASDSSRQVRERQFEASVWRYTFLLGSTGQIRYDYADTLSLYHQEFGLQLEFQVREFPTSEDLKLTMFYKDETLDMDFKGGQ